MRAVLFDFNGTMFFDESFQNLSWRQYIKEKAGRDVSDGEFQERIHGKNIEEIMAYFLKREVCRAEAAAMEEEKESIYRALCLESPLFRLADGLADFLDALAARAVPMTIATASGENNVRFFFRELGLDRWFDFDKVVFNDGSFRGKPAPDIYLMAAEKIGADIKSCVVFEDARAGIASARNAGAHRVIGLESMQSRSVLLSWGADHSIKDYTDRETLLETHILC